MTRPQSIVWKAVLALALSLPAAAPLAAELPQATLAGTLAEPLRAPGQMALDSQRVLYVADVQNRGVVKFDAYGTYLGVIPVPGVVRSVAVTADDRLLVSHDGSVDCYAASGTLLASLSGYGFDSPSGIALDPAGNIYVADSKKNQVAVFNSAGLFVSAFGTKGSGAGEFNFPADLAWEKVSGQLAVVDTMNNRVQFFDATGLFKRVIGTPAALSGPLKFTYPQGISFDYASGVRMYVADAFQSSVQVIELGALPRFLGYIGNFGTATGELRRPCDVLLDPATFELLVSDGGRVNIYGLTEAAAADGSGATTDGSATSTGSTGSTGAAGGGSATPGTAGSKIAASWQYPAGDCRHARAGSLVCRDR